MRELSILKGPTLSKSSGDINSDIAGVGCDLAFPTGCCLGNADSAGRGFGDKYLFRKQGARNVTCTRFNRDLCSVAIFKSHITCVTLHRKAARCHNIFQGYSACIGFDINAVFSGCIIDRDLTCCCSKVHLFCRNAIYTDIAGT